MTFFEDFCDEISTGISNTVVLVDGREVDPDDAVNLCIEKIRSTNEKGGLLFFCGNGASCTIAEHMSHDWFQNGKVNTYTCSETSHITAISNDVSYEDVFSYRIGRILGEKDILVTISSSGNSPNIIKAIKTAKEKGALTIAFCGMKPDNKSRQFADISFWVPLGTYGLVESSHSLLLHEILDLYLDRYQGGRHR